MRLVEFRNGVGEIYTERSVFRQVHQFI
ncbi:protein of unknown function [Burkholderia multivorans]